MSEFFRNFEDEENKPQRKTTSYHENSSESQEKVSNKEKKVAELHDEISALESGLTTKKLDNFLKNSKKYKTIFKNGLPDFVHKSLENVLQNKKVNQTNKNKITKFIAQYKSSEKQVDVVGEMLGVEKDVVKEEDIEVILNDKIILLSAEEDADDKLINLITNDNTVGMNFKVYFTLFNFYLKRKASDYKKIMETFMNMVELSKQEPMFMGVDFRPLLSENLSYYLNYIVSILTEKEYNDFESKLESIKSVNEEAVNRVALEFQFLALKKNIDTEDTLFRLLHITRKEDYTEAKKYYEANDIYKENDRATNAILNEFGILAFKNFDYRFAFQILQQCFLNDYVVDAIYLFIVAILIEVEIIDEPFYDYFLDSFRHLDENPFLCESEDQKMEIQRAYFYIKNYDNVSAVSILKNLVPHSQYKKVLDEKIVLCN